MKLLITTCFCIVFFLLLPAGLLSARGFRPDRLLQSVCPLQSVRPLQPDALLQPAPPLQPARALPSAIKIRPAQDSLPACKQEIVGRVFLVSGNRMPAPGKPGPVNKGVRATVLIYELTNISQTVRQGQSPYYSAIRTRLVEKLETDERGNFTACVPAGQYSVFVKKGNLLYANRFDTHNNIAPVGVLAGIPTVVDCPLEGASLSW